MMIDVYFWPTPNGHKVTIALEEMGLDYTIKPVDISKGAQFEPSFLAFSPNNRMPAIIDHNPTFGDSAFGGSAFGNLASSSPASSNSDSSSDSAPTESAHSISASSGDSASNDTVHSDSASSGDSASNDLNSGDSQAVFESGAILLYLAEKTGRFLPSSGAERIAVMEWLMWQMGGFGPMLGQAHHFNLYAPEPIPYAIERYSTEANRLYGVLDRRLEVCEWLAGADYSIADMAAFPWSRTFKRQGVDLTDYPNVKRWREAMSARPQVERGMAAGAELRQDLSKLSAEDSKKLFGKKG
jgi:GST-like protein